jgi:hypothetical protein
MLEAKAGLLKPPQRFAKEPILVKSDLPRMFLMKPRGKSAAAVTLTILILSFSLSTAYFIAYNAASEIVVKVSRVKIIISGEYLTVKVELAVNNPTPIIFVIKKVEFQVSLGVYTFSNRTFGLTNPWLPGENQAFANVTIVMSRTKIGEALNVIMEQAKRPNAEYMIDGILTLETFIIFNFKKDFHKHGLLANNSLQTAEAAT